jgi:hypothetical protein
MHDSCRGRRSTRRINHAHLVAGELLGALEGEVRVRGPVHDAAREGDGVLDGRDAGDGTAAAAAAVHDAGLHLHGAAARERGPAARVEEGVRLELAHHGLHHVERGGAGAERVHAHLQAPRQNALRLLLALLRQVRVHARAAVDRDGPACHFCLSNRAPEKEDRSGCSPLFSSISRATAMLLWDAGGRRRGCVFIGGVREGSQHGRDGRL